MWIFFGVMISGFAIAYSLEMRNSNRDETESSKTNGELNEWKNLESKSKIMLIFLGVSFSFIIAGALSVLRFILIPDQATADVKVYPNVMVWILPALYIGLPLAGLLIDKVKLSGMSAVQKASFKFYQRGRNKLNYDRFCKRVAFVTIIPSLLLILIWMNSYFYIKDNVIVFNNGIPFGEKQYALSDVNVIQKRFASDGTKNRDFPKPSFTIVFSDGFELDIDKEYFFSSRHSRLRAIELLSKANHVQIE